MSIGADGQPIQPASKSEPKNIAVRADSVFFGFTVTEIREDAVSFVSNQCRYILDNGPIEKAFTFHQGEKIRLKNADILDAAEIIVVELSDVNASDRYVYTKNS